MFTNLKITLRSFAKSPGFTATAISTVGLCLGANLAIFAGVNSVLLRPLPFPDADRLVVLFNTYPKAGVHRDGASLTNYYERRDQIPAFSSIATFREESAIVGETGSTERVSTARVSPEFFSTVGVGPKLGRAFDESETTHQTDSVVILSDAYWRQHFNANPEVLGRELRVDGFPKKIVGVLPPNFRFLSSEARLYFPRSSDPGQRIAAERHSGSSTLMIARLAPGATIAEAQSQIDAHDASIAHSYPHQQMIADAGFRSVVAPLHADHVRGIRPTLLLMQAGALFLLVIGMVNLINLLLIRASSRAREFAIRQSIGATRRHVIGEVMIETVSLCTLGGIAGILVAAFGIDLLESLGASRLPLGAHIDFDDGLALGGLGCAIVLGVLIAVPVAWLNLRVHLAHALQSASRGMTAGRTAQKLRHAFIVTQIALAFVLLTGAGLLGVSLQRALAVSPGFQPGHVISGQLSLPWKTYRESAALLSFAERLGEQIRQQPGVSAAGVVTNLPLSGNSGMSAVIVKGHVVRPGESVRGHYTYGIIGDYFAAMGIPLKKGRLLGTDDSRRDERVCVVDEDFVRRYWPAGDAIGQQIFQGAGEKPDSEAFTVVGVVGAVKQADVTELAALGAAYFPLKYRADLSLFVVARATMPPATLGPVVQGIVRQIDPELPVNDLRTMEARIADSLVARRSPALLSAIFSGVALLLAAIGTYGVLSYAVAQRHREIGVRVALGALPRQIRDQFLSVGFRLLAVGTALGVVGAAIAGGAMQTVLFEVPALHAPTLIATATIMTAVSLLACWLPASRATKVDPITALRAE